MDRLTEKATPKGSLTYTHDAENHLVSMGSTVALVYDGDGNRVSKTVTTSSGSTTTTYLIDDLNPTGYPQVVDELVNGAVSVTYTYGFQRISEDRVVSGSIVPSWYMYDGMGNVRGLTNSAGTQTDTYEYDAFGNDFTVTGGNNTPNEMMYRGEQWDSDLGLYYLRARYYNPITGRFMSRDPRDGYLDQPPTLHKYLYAGGDPVNLFDPTGQATMTKPTGGIGEGVGEYLGILQDISLRFFIATQVTLPIYLQTEQGKAAQLLFLTGVSIAASYSCEFAEEAEELRDYMETVLDPNLVVVKGPGLNCNIQKDPRPGGAGEGDGPEE